MKKNNEILTEEELQIERDLENGLFEEITDENYKKEIENSFKAYKQQRKDETLTLRVRGDIKEKVKQRAEQDGLNYQSLINMLIFKYANGELNLKIVQK